MAARVRSRQRWRSSEEGSMLGHRLPFTACTPRCCCARPQVSTELRATVQRLYYDTLTCLDAALLNVCTAFDTTAYSKVGARDGWGRVCVEVE